MSHQLSNLVKLAHERKKYFINRFNLLNTNQFCFFLAGQNTSDAPDKFLNEAYDASNQIRVLLTVFSGFSKAFGTVDREIILKNYILQWLQR